MNGIGIVDLGIGVAFFIAIFWWMLSLSTKSSAQRREERIAATTRQDPWESNGKVR